MTEVRTPSEDEREQVADVLRVSLNLGETRRAERTARLPLEQMRAVVEHGRVVATAGARDFTQWFGGREIAMSGIWGVATLPEQRGGGLATRAVSELLHVAREKGQPISALYPATLRLYRGLGYELAGTYTEHELSLNDLPRGPGGPFDVAAIDPERDLADVRACYRSTVADQTGPIDSDEPRWWEDFVTQWWSEGVSRAVLARSERGVVEAYAAFTQEGAEGDLEGSFRVQTDHLVASSVEGWASLLSYLRGFRGLGVSVRFTGPPAHPLAMLIEEQRVRSARTFRWMLRLLDVPAALRQRGYPPASGEAVLEVEDGLFPQNRGPWRVVAREGTVTVEPAPGVRVRPTPIGTLSSMFTGYLSAHDAARLGLIEASMAPFLASLFAGPHPWMYDWF